MKGKEEGRRKEEEGRESKGKSNQ